MLTKKNLSRFLFVTVLMATLLVLTPRPAHASAVCDLAHICGWVKNNSSRDLYISGNLVAGGAPVTYILHPGQNSASIGLPDVDNVGSPTSNLRVNEYVVGPWQYIKIHDWMAVTCWDATVSGSAGVACYWP